MNSPPQAEPTSVANVEGTGHVLVTGASRGIGQHLAAGLAEAGWTVHGTATTFNGVATIEDAGHTGWCVDVRNYSAVVEVVDQIESSYGALDCLVNNAGVIETSDAPIWELDPEDVARVVDVNVVGAFHLIRAVVPKMLARGAGRVINLNSGAGVRSSSTYPAYHASKSALFRLGGALHEAGFERGIRAFELAPGVVDTAMTRSMPVWDGKTDWTDPADVVALVQALADGALDAWSGRMVRAGVDTPESLKVAAAGLETGDRCLGLITYGPGDPLERSN